VKGERKHKEKRSKSNPEVQKNQKGGGGHKDKGTNYVQERDTTSPQEAYKTGKRKGKGNLK
jgi:hypothetical protein